MRCRTTALTGTRARPLPSTCGSQLLRAAIVASCGWPMAIALPCCPAGMGNDPRLRGVGGRADPGPAGRCRDRCHLGPLHPVARDLTPPATGRPSAAAGVIPPRGLRRVFAEGGKWQLSAESGRSPNRDRAAGVDPNRSFTQTSRASRLMVDLPVRIAESG
jgi:hypothetical protein